MTEKSYFWDGLVTGDAVLSPYSSDLWHSLWQVMFSRANNEGVLNNIDNELVVSGVAVAVSVATGKALVDGSLYESSEAVSVTIPTPVTDPRIDRIVLQKDWSSKTIRIARVAGTENASPTAPNLTQTAGSIWEMPLAQVLITTAGVIAVTDERENARTRLALASAGISTIETFTATGVEASVDFINIPSIYRHLMIQGNILSSVASVGAGKIKINGDSTVGNYNRQIWGRAGGSVVAAANAGVILPPIDTLGSNALSSSYNTQIDFYIPNYRDTNFYKSISQKENTNVNNTAADLNVTHETFLWLNTDAIDRITITPDAGVLEVGTVITLYGID